MPKTVRFLTECAGRRKGVTETINDDTLADTWVNAKLAEVVDAPSPVVEPQPGQKAPERPPKDRMIRRAPRTR